ncbi:MAG: MFS transporter [Granulosicoccaceae bacterium]
MSLTAFSIDISLPFFPAIASSLQSPLSAMPLIVTVYLLFMGVGNLVFGPLSDKYGRKPVLSGTLFVFIVGAIVCGLADSLRQLLVGRALQGFAVGAAPVVATAILRDMFSGRELGRSMAISTGIFSVGPIVAPLLGVGLAELGGSWRTVFYATAVYAALLLLALLLTPETNKTPSADATKPSVLWRNSKTILFHPQSGYFLMLSAITTVAMILIVSTSPAIFNNEFGITGAKFAVLFALHGTGIIVGQLLNHQLIAIVGIVKTALIAALIMGTSTMLIVLFALMGWLNEYWLSFLVAFFAVGYLSVVANSMTMLMQPHGDKAGLAASLRGATSALVATVGSSALALFVQNSALLWGGALFGVSLISISLLYRWQRQHPN